MSTGAIEGAAQQAPALAGHADARMAPLKDAFLANFRDHGDVGAAVSVVLEGRTVVDLWAGWADPRRTRVWERDTIVDVFSVGKPMIALCLLILVERGEVGLDDPLALMWPEFAACGKEGITARMVLAHRAGLPAIARPLVQDAMYDWHGMTGALAAQRPWWEPGTAHGYHVNTFGFLVGEIVRRASGLPAGRFFQREVAGPLGADFQFGVPAEQHGRVAEFMFPQMPALDPAAPPTMKGNAYVNPRGLSGYGTVNTARWRQAEIPSSNGHSNARAVARIYSTLISAAGAGILGPATVALASSEASSGPDLVLDRPSRFGLGFQLTQPERRLGPNPGSFGHFGAGGSLGFADPDAAVAFAYTPNQGLGPRWQNPRNRALIDALYASL